MKPLTRALRNRLEEYAAFAREHRKINRADMARIGEVSITQASADVKALMDHYPSLGLAYDKSKKTFVVGK